jgi:hypothetical protein
MQDRTSVSTPTMVDGIPVRMVPLSACFRSHTQEPLPQALDELHDLLEEVEPSTVPSKILPSHFRIRRAVVPPVARQNDPSHCELSVAHRPPLRLALGRRHCTPDQNARTHWSQIGSAIGRVSIAIRIEGRSVAGQSRQIRQSPSRIAISSSLPYAISRLRAGPS